MFEPIRGGTRGGQAEFKWSDVSADKDRENYLGHSINAPTGRWQKNKDVHWYNRDANATSDERAEEIRKIKEAEAEALSIALGFGPSKKETSSTSTQGTGTNAIPIPPSSLTTNAHVDPDEATRAAEKAERRQRKAERREEKMARKLEKAARKEQRRTHNDRRHDDPSPRSPTPVRQHRDSRSPLPKRHRSYDISDRDDLQHGRYQRSRDHYSPDGGRFRDRSRSPRRHDSRGHSEHRSSPYNHRCDEDERENERLRDRQRWGHNARRHSPGGGRWGRN